LGRGPDEPVNEDLRNFYDRLLGCLHRAEVRDGEWRLLECMPAWNENWTWDCFICFGWKGLDGRSLGVVVNYAPNESQCYLRIPVEGLQGKTLHFADLMGPATYDRPADEVREHGLYLDLGGWGYHVFEVSSRAGG
jgi:hypothetical protein